MHVMSPREGGTRTSCNVSIKQDRQFKYNVTLRRVRAPTAAVEKQWVLHNLSVCVCVCVCVCLALDIQHECAYAML